MTLLLFTTLNCKWCREFNKTVAEFVKKYGVHIKIYDIENEKNLSMNIAAMRKYSLDKTPTLIIKNNEVEVFRVETTLSEESLKTITELLQHHE